MTGDNVMTEKQADEITFDAEQIKTIRRAVLVGLSAYGEIERLCNAVEIAERGGSKIDNELRPLHPTASAETVSEFADALRYLERTPT